MKNFVFVLITLISSIAGIGCGSQPLLSAADSAKINITYSSIIYPDMVPSVL